MTSELQQTRYDQLVRRVGALIGPGAKVAEALAELFPVLDLENLPPELLFLSGQRIAHGGASFVAPVAEFSKIQLFNPVGSGKLVTVTQFTARQAAAGQIRIGVNAIALATGVGTEIIRDTRINTITLPVAQIRQAGGAALSGATVQFRNTADEFFNISDPNGIAVLGPGTGYEIGVSNAATRLTVNFWWKERVAEQSELLF